MKIKLVYSDRLDKNAVLAAVAKVLGQLGIPDSIDNIRAMVKQRPPGYVWVTISAGGVREFNRLDQRIGNLCGRAAETIGNHLSGDANFKIRHGKREVAGFFEVNRRALCHAMLMGNFQVLATIGDTTLYRFGWD